MNIKTVTQHKLLLVCCLSSLLVFAAEIPDALPAGFLEQLPTMMEMDADEYAAFLEFTKQNSGAQNNTEEEPDKTPMELNHES